MIYKALLSTLLILASRNVCVADDNMDLIDHTKAREHIPISPSQAAEAKKIGKFLDELYRDCGRYPTTQEGLKALVSKPKTLDCKKWVKAYLPTVPSRKFTWTSRPKIKHNNP